MIYLERIDIFSEPILSHVPGDLCKEQLEPNSGCGVLPSKRRRVTTRSRSFREMNLVPVFIFSSPPPLAAASSPPQRANTSCARALPAAGQQQPQKLRNGYIYILPDDLPAAASCPPVPSGPMRAQVRRASLCKRSLTPPTPAAARRAQGGQRHAAVFGWYPVPRRVLEWLRGWKRNAAVPQRLQLRGPVQGRDAARHWRFVIRQRLPLRRRVRERSHARLLQVLLP